MWLMQLDAQANTWENNNTLLWYFIMNECVNSSTSVLECWFLLGVGKGENVIKKQVVCFMASALLRR